MEALPHTDFSALTALAAASADVTRTCTCANAALAAWAPFPLALVDAAL